MKQNKPMKIAILGHSKASISVIERAEECGMTLECINTNQIDNVGITINKQLEDELSMPIYNPARDWNMIKPITRAERRSKNHNKRRKF